MADFSETWSRGRRESGNTTEQWVSDLRTVSVLFCCLGLEQQIKERVDAEGRCELFQGIFLVLQRAVYKHGGVVRQFLVDDKGCVLIAVFGLVAHENDPERATRCAMSINKHLQRMQIISSIGVTTGKVFCGESGRSMII